MTLTSQRLTTVQKPTMTNKPTTTKRLITIKQRQTIKTFPVTKSPASTQPATSLSTFTSEPNICSRSSPKDILFILDGTRNYQKYWWETRKEWEKVKAFVKDLALDLNNGKNRIAVMQYGGLISPRMAIEFSAQYDIVNRIGRISLLGGRQRMTHKALALASNKVSEFHYIAFFCRHTI